MLTSWILIVDQMPRSEVYSLKLQADTDIHIEAASSEEEVLEKALQFEPDLIILSTQFNDVDGYSLCKKLRNQNYITRPVIVMVSNKERDEVSDRIEGLRSGADDFINFSINDEEFSARILAHLRRHFEELSNQLTKLPGPNISNTNLKRRINLKTPWALMLLSLENFQTYNDTYGYLAGSQLMKAFVAISKAHLYFNDFMGQIGNLDFAILTNPLKAEVLAEQICRTFDQVVPKFYAPFEAERGYTIITDDERASRKVPLVSVSIGIVTNTYRYFDNYQTAMSIAASMRDLARHQMGSGWLIDRPLLTGEELHEVKHRKPYILVIESDAALAYLLTTTLEMEGYTVDATTNKDEAIGLIKEHHPDIVVIDAIIPGDEGWSICRYIRTHNEFKSTRIIMATVLHDKDKAFSAGADLYIPKPYELLALHKWINRLLNDNIF